MQIPGCFGEVTGSKYLLQVDGFNLMVHCGLFQGRKELRMHNREPFPLEPRRIDAIVITHAHLDHTGCLSAHADRSEFLDWLGGFTQSPGQTFVVHGEADAAGDLASTLRQWGWNARVPRYLDEAELSQNI